MSDQETDHGHDHPSLEGDADLTYYAMRYRAIEELLIEKEFCTQDEIQRVVDETEMRSPLDGARVVARAWIDPEYKARLLADAIAAVAELGYVIPDNMPGLTAVENTDEVHNLVVCTLCSCYPRALLGRPPAWYKSLNYRSRAVIDPRGVMEEFGLELDESVEVRVQDSTADMRFLILPRRPAGTEHMSEDDLAKLVTRDSMIGVVNPRSPEPSLTR